MQDFFDRLENRTAASREAALFRDLHHVLAVSKSRVPALRVQLKGLDLAKLRNRADLSRVPLTRRADLLAAQAETPPFGGFIATRLAGLAQVFIGPRAVATPGGHAKDWWGLARGLYAAGLRKGMLALNAFSYDLVPHGHMADAGARAIGCPILPAGNAEPPLVIEAIGRFNPSFFCGPAERLRQVLDAGLDAGLDMRCLRGALVTGAYKFGLRSEFSMRGIEARHALVLPEVGLVAYESGDTDGMTLVEGLVLELVDPQTGLLVKDGDEGEIVVSRTNLDFPLLRYATGLKTSLLRQPSTCGRTNLRLATPRGIVDENEVVGGEGRHIFEIRARHPNLRMHLSFSGGSPHLLVEHRDDEPGLREWLGKTLHMVTRRNGIVEIVKPGSLPDDEVAGAPGGRLPN